jgi:pyruvate/2-oxoglutarate dehydrogenase complex dihydrolipoamide dehydrogenase (E3) component
MGMLAAMVRTNLPEGGDATTNDRLVPHKMMMDSQLGRIGLTEKQFEAHGLSHRVAKAPASSVARALDVGETTSLMKAALDAGAGQTLGG